MKKLLCAIMLMILVASVYGLDFEKFSLSKELISMGYVSTSQTDLNVPKLVKADEEIPTAFDLRDVDGVSYVKPVRDCDVLSEHLYVGWAFGAMAAAESSYMMKNEGSSPYFSVTNLINRNPLSAYFEMDEFNTKSLSSIFGYFQNLTGPVNENDDPYTEPYESPEVQPDSLGYIDNITCLSDDTVLGFDEAERLGIKTAIMKTGAVFMIHQATPLDDVFDADYKYCYCNSESPYPSHGAIIIGWDDEFDKTKFKTEPTENGAYLIKNCFGTLLHDDGYYWVSYEDTSLSQAVSFDFTAKDDAFYNDLITYNTLPLDSTTDPLVNATYAKIQYTAKTSGEITGIRPWFKYVGLNSEFVIYVNEVEKGSISVVSGCYGYESIELDSTIYYNKDDIITVCCDYNKGMTPGYNDPIPLEKNIKVSQTEIAEINFTEGTNYYARDTQAYFDLKDEHANIAFSLLVQRRDVKVTFDKETLEMHPRDVETITATVTGTEITELEWASSDESVATVDEDGVVTAVSEGETVISATTVDGKVTATCNVVVTNVIAESLTLDNTTLNIDTGYTKKLVATILPENTTFNTVTWSSSNSEIATVDENGVVKGLKEGTCTVIAAIPDGLTAKCKIIVEDVDVAAVVLNKTTAKIDTSSKVQLTATILPDNATYKTIKWTSSNSKIATVSNKGLVRGVYPGKVTIKATATNGMYAECVVTVKNIPVKSISLNKTKLQMNTRTSAKLTVTFNPSNASYKDITWISSNTKIATVNSRGTVTSKSLAGEATITAKSKNGKKATCVVTVSLVPVEDVKINKTKIDLNLVNNKSYQLVAKVVPTNATNQSVTWKSTNTKIAKVNSKGLVTAVGVGSCLVVVETKDGGYVKTCRVNVKGIPVDYVVLDKSVVATTVGEKTQLNATIYPKSATNKKVTWSSSNTKVAKVDKNGVVKAVGVGKATIKVVSQDSGVSDSCKFTVKM